MVKCACHVDSRSRSPGKPSLHPLEKALTGSGERPRVFFWLLPQSSLCHHSCLGVINLSNWSRAEPWAMELVRLKARRTGRAGEPMPGLRSCNRRARVLEGTWKGKRGPGSREGLGPRHNPHSLYSFASERTRSSLYYHIRFGFILIHLNQHRCIKGLYLYIPCSRILTLQGSEQAPKAE